MNKYSKNMYDNYKVKVYDALEFYNNENNLLKYYKEEIINDLKNIKTLNLEDEFILDNKLKKEEMNKLKRLFENEYYNKNYNSNSSFLNTIARLEILKTKKESEIKEINFSKNKNNKYHHYFNRYSDDIDNIKIRIYFDCCELNKKILFEFIKNFSFKLEFNGFEIYNLNFFNIMFQFNDSIKINYDDKYIEFKIIKESINISSLSYTSVDLYISFEKFNNYKNFILITEECFLEHSNRIYKNNTFYKTLEFKNYNNLNYFINSFSKSYSFLIYFNDIDYIKDIKSINIITNNNDIIELEYNLFYIGDIPFYIVYSDNRIENINTFIDKYFTNFEKNNEFVYFDSSNIKSFNIQFYEKLDNYNNKIGISNLNLNIIEYGDKFAYKKYVNN